MIVLDGKKIAEDVLARLRAQPVPEKFFAGILIGDDPASASFQAIKERTAKDLGVDYRIYHLDAKLGMDGLREEVGRIALQKPCGGAIVQLPLPAGIDRHVVLNAIPREKDVDVLGERGLGAFYTGRNPISSPAVGTVEEILKVMNVSLVERTVAVVGLGILIGRPIANWLMGKAKEVHLVGRASNYEILKQADIVILGTGHAGFVKPEMLKSGAGVIDFGYGKNVNGEMSGDFDSSLPSPHLAFYTPTPGGTGPILVAKLFENFYKLNKE